MRGDTEEHDENVGEGPEDIELNGRNGYCQSIDSYKTNTSSA